MRNYPKLIVRLSKAEGKYEISDTDTKEEQLYHLLIETNSGCQFDAAYILTHYNVGSDVEMNLTLDDLESLGGQLIRLALLKELRDEI